MSTEISEPPATENAALDAGGDTFESNLAARTSEQTAAEKPGEKPPEKAGDKAATPPDKAVVKPTPLDLPAQKPDAAPVDEDAELTKALAAEPPANASQSLKSNHAKVRDAYYRANQARIELAAQLEEARKTTKTVDPELESKWKAAEERAAQREAELERVAFERSPKFQAFNKDADDELTAAKGYIEGSEIDPNIIELAARAKGAKRVGILTDAGLDGNLIGGVMAHLSRIDSIERQKAAAQENWKGTQAQWEIEQRTAQEKQAAAVKEHEDKVFSTVGKLVSEKIEPFQRVDGNDEWNAGVEKRLAEVKAVFDGTLPLEKTSEVLYKGVAFDVIHEAWHDLRRKYNDLITENERIKAVSPGAPRTATERGGTVSTGDPLQDAASTFDENLARRSGRA